MNVDLIVRNECVCVDWKRLHLGPLFIPATCARTDRQEIPVYILNFPYPLRLQHHHHHHHHDAQQQHDPQRRRAASASDSSRRSGAAMPRCPCRRYCMCLCVGVRVCACTLNIQHDDTPRLPASWFSAPWPGSNIPSVEEENRFLAGPCLLHPTHCRLFKCVGLFIRQTSHFHVLSLLDSTRAVCVGTQWRTVPALLMCLLPLSALDKHESSPRTQPGC
jgi:hypothetical protein